MHLSWVEGGGDPDRFWQLTPREIARELQGMATRQRHRHDELAWLAWHVAALSRAKKLPKLKDMLSSTKRTAGQRQSAEVQEAMIKALFLANGGNPDELKRLQ